jgi:hypothetical protein
LGRHAYDPGSSPTGVLWITRIPDDSVNVDVENGTATLHLTNVPVFDFFTVANSLDPAHRLDAAAALINAVRVEWSGVTRRLEFSDAENTFAGVFLENSAAIALQVTTVPVPDHAIPGFRFVSDGTTQSLFAQISEERNGIFFPQGS